MNTHKKNATLWSNVECWKWRIEISMCTWLRVKVQWEIDDYDDHPDDAGRYRDWSCPPRCVLAVEIDVDTLVWLCVWWCPDHFFAPSFALSLALSLSRFLYLSNTLKVCAIESVHPPIVNVMFRNAMNDATSAQVIKWMHWADRWRRLVQYTFFFISLFVLTLAHTAHSQTHTHTHKCGVFSKFDRGAPLWSLLSVELLSLEFDK